jgi:hypothetical protein
MLTFADRSVWRVGGLSDSFSHADAPSLVLFGLEASDRGGGAEGGGGHALGSGEGGGVAFWSRIIEETLLQGLGSSAREWVGGGKGGGGEGELGGGQGAAESCEGLVGSILSLVPLPGIPYREP